MLQVSLFVIAGLDPAILQSQTQVPVASIDDRIKSGHDKGVLFARFVS